MWHPQEETLITYASDPAAAEDYAEVTEHLQGCGDCRLLAEMIRTDLASPRRPVSATRVAAIAALERQLIEEEDVATAQIRRLLTEGNEGRLKGLEDVLTTPGAIRAAIQELPRLRHTDPSDALTFARTAITAAEKLLPQSAEPRLERQLLGALWKDLAATLRVLGRFGEALSALRTAEDHFLEASANDFELAGVWLGRANVLREIDELDPALHAVQQAREAYERFGDSRMVDRADYLHGMILYRQSRFAEAQQVFQTLLPRVVRSGDRQIEASLYNALGQCAVDLRNWPAAEALLAHGEEAFRALGWPLEVLRTRWVRARLLVARGNFHEGVRALREMQRAFFDKGLSDEVALVGLDIADALLAQEQFAEAAEVCREVVQILRDGGSTANVIRAVEYLRESTARGAASRNIVRAVRLFIETGAARTGSPFRPSATA